MSEKKTFNVIYTETLVHKFEIEASTPEEAKKVFEERNNKGEFDFSYGELVDSSITVEGGETNEFLKYEAFCNEISKIRGAAVYGDSIDDEPYVEIGIIDDDFINAVKEVIHKFDYMTLEEHECEGSNYPSYCIWFGEVEQ